MLLEIGLITMLSMDKPDLLGFRESSKVVPYASLQAADIVARYETEVSEYNKTEKYSLQVGYRAKEWLELGAEMRKEGDFIYLKVSHTFGK